MIVTATATLRTAEAYDQIEFAAEEVGAYRSDYAMARRMEE